MEYQKIANLIDDASNQPSKFRTKIRLKDMINEKEHTMLITRSKLKP